MSLGRFWDKKNSKDNRYENETNYFCWTSEDWIMLISLIFLFSTFYSIYAPQHCSLEFLIFLDFMFFYLLLLLFMLSNYYAEMLIFLDSMTLDVPQDLINWEWVKELVDFMVFTLPSIKELVYLVSVSLDLVFDLITLIFHIFSVEMWWYMMLVWGIPLLELLFPSTFILSNISNLIANHSNELLLFFLHLSFSNSLSWDQYLFMEVPWAVLEETLPKLFLSLDIYNKPKSSSLAFWLYFDILFEKFTFDNKFLNNPFSYDFLFSYNQTPMSSFYLFIQFCQPDDTPFVFKFTQELQLKIIMDDKVTKPLFLDKNFLLLMESDFNLGTIKPYRK